MANRENYLERVPQRPETIGWTRDDKNIVTLEIENKGIFCKITQKLFKKPKISYIHLDRHGSIVWQLIDGESDIIKIGEKVKELLGDEAEPLYERLAKYFNILESYKFIEWK